MTRALPGIAGTSGLSLTSRGRTERARSFADSWEESPGRGQVTSLIMSSIATSTASLFASPVSVWARGSVPVFSAGFGSGATVASARAPVRVTPPSCGRVELGVQVSVDDASQQHEVGVQTLVADSDSRPRPGFLPLGVSSPSGSLAPLPPPPSPPPANS